MEIKCPKCNEVFDLSEDIANRIREQVRTKEFEKEIKSQLTAAEKRYETMRENAVNESILSERKKYDKLLEDERKKTTYVQIELEKIKTQTAAIEQQTNDKISAVKETCEANIRSATIEAAQKEREKYEKKLQETKDEADRFKGEAQKAKNDLALAVMQSEMDIKQAVMNTKSEYDNKLASLENEKKAVEHERDYYKDLKSRMSTKMLGETLEQHCEIAFEQVRMMAFPKAEFGKDNQRSESGSKGDYIFREYDENNIEIISIMFEMKNENDTTATKKKNKNFFKELDKDRREKNCEYAILVSLLEADSDIYNRGIVDVSYEYDKMYVIRPQFFIPLISLLRNAALRSHSAKQELERMKQQDIDLQNFEAAFADFKDKFSNNYKDATNRFNDAIKEIDKTIDQLVKVKENLLLTNKHLSAANNKVDSVSVRKLTKNSPSIRAMLNEKNED